ncbi:MAG: hypothetical protein ACR2MF_00160, partial [Chthoniobacterales bacterium]
VEVPTLDDWEMGGLIVKAQKGLLDFSDLFTQQQEGRTILSKLIFIVSAAARGHWDVRDQMMISVISCWLTAAGLFFMLYRGSRLSLIALATCFWLSVLTIFTPAQFELWLLASGFPSFLPALFIVTSLVAVQANLSTLGKFLICALLSTASSFTLPHGLLAWGLTFPVLLVTHRLRRWPVWLAMWLVTCALCTGAYFWGYHKPEYLPQFAPQLAKLEYVRFVLIFLGGGLAYSWHSHPAAAAMMFGALQIALLFLVLAYTVMRLNNHAFICRTAPWFALAAYSIGSAFLAALGRVEYGASYALASRYVTFSLYLTVALIVLSAVIASEAGGRPGPPFSRRWLWASCAVLFVSYLIPYKLSATNTLYFLRGYSAKDRLARGAILFSGVIDTSEVISQVVYPVEADRVIRTAADLDALKLIRPRLARTTNLHSLPHADADGRRVEGACESTEPSPSKLRRAVGWAALKDKRRQADCVVLAYELPSEEPVLFAMSNTVEARPDIARRLRNDDQLWTGWTATYSERAVPTGAKVSFWAVDADGPKFYRLSDSSR